MKKLLALLLTAVMVLSLGSALANEKIVIGATPTPHAEVLELVKDDMAALGYDLVIEIYTEYPIPNPATAGGDLDANYFQHMPYLNAYNASVDEAQQLVAAIPVHYEPYGVYAGTKTTLDELAEGDSIAITNDPSNEARALLLLQQAGLITLPEGSNADSVLTVLDIVDNPKKLEIIEMNAELLPASLVDVSYAVINGNFAIGAGLNPSKDALLLEDATGDVGVQYTNYVVVKPENAEAPWVEALRSVLQSDKVKEYMLNNEDYKGGVIPTF